MVYFDCDYMTGAHPGVLRALCETNTLSTPGYGQDSFCESARRKILEACGIPEGDVFFMVGGTQTNATVIDWLIGRGQGAVCADTGHINVHEAGAIEACGHKVIGLPANDGKIDADTIRDYIHDFYADDTWQHIVPPSMVYLSFPTELGTLYTRPELEAIADVCHDAGIPLYIDGARLAFGLAASEDLSLPDLARIADIFYIGGTKCGSLFGEAVVSKDPSLLKGFMTHVKSTFIDSPTNQQFFILPNTVLDALRRTSVSFELWGPRGASESKVRFVTSWSTTPADLQALAEALP